jgi:hypothetical protein
LRLVPLPTHSHIFEKKFSDSRMRPRGQKFKFSQRKTKISQRCQNQSFRRRGRIFVTEYCNAEVLFAYLKNDNDCGHPNE